MEAFPTSVLGISRTGPVSPRVRCRVRAAGKSGSEDIFPSHAQACSAVRGSSFLLLSSRGAGGPWLWGRKQLLQAGGTERLAQSHPSLLGLDRARPCGKGSCDPWHCLLRSFMDKENTVRPGTSQVRSRDLEHHFWSPDPGCPACTAGTWIEGSWGGFRLASESLPLRPSLGGAE